MNDTPFPLFLDDERNVQDVTWIKLPEVTWQIVRSMEEFVDYILKNGIPPIISFDHDLGEGHYPFANATMEYHFKNGKIPYEILDGKTGYDAAKWLCDYCQEKKIKFPDYLVHSMNPIGAENIRCYIENYKKNCE